MEKYSCQSIAKSNRRETQQLVKIQKQNFVIAAIVVHMNRLSQPLQNRRDAVERKEEQEEQRHWPTIQPCSVNLESIHGRKTSISSSAVLYLTFW